MFIWVRIQSELISIPLQRILWYRHINFKGFPRGWDAFPLRATKTSLVLNRCSWFYFVYHLLPMGPGVGILIESFPLIWCRQASIWIHVLEQRLYLLPAPANSPRPLFDSYWQHGGGGAFHHSARLFWSLWEPKKKKRNGSKRAPWLDDTITIM